MLAVVCASVPSEARGTSSKYAAIVIDARTGKVLHSENADSRRYPASLTKMMTLYLTFEAMERGKIRKSSPVRFSANAASQPPTKLGVRAGGTITVEQAIYALITRSANDASVALAETIGGSERRFAQMMTQKARSLGMRGTVFRNPNGLPNPGQFTTARDMATLGIALREHFSQYYGYFSVRSFKFGRQRIANHNRLLGKVRGVDGIKTGYTRASGFNLVSSVSDGNRRLVAVVLGGNSGGARDARMAQLIDANMSKARSGGGQLIARSSKSSSRMVAESALPDRQAPTPDLRADDTVQMAAVDQSGADETANSEMAEGGEPGQLEQAEVAVSPKSSRRRQQEETPVQAFAAVEPASESSVDKVATASTSTGKWVIQVASSPNKSEAKAALARTQDAVPALADAAGYTVAFEKSGATYYRARFGGFESKSAAGNACTALKRKKIACYATQQD